MLKSNLILLATALLLAVPAHANDNMEASLAISSPETLKALEQNGFSLGDLLSRSATTGVIDNQELAKSASFKTILDNLKKELASYQKSHANSGVGLQFDARLFDLNYLENARARFVLVGLINRMDAGFKSQNRCGEIRFIYRLAYSVEDHGTPVSSRLPMTINLLFHGGSASDDASCATLAQAWLRVTPETSASDLIANGPLSANLFKRDAIKDLEINMQIERLSASARPDFGGHAEYLLKVYKWIDNGFQESTLENQVDYATLAKDPALLAELKKWILDPQNLKSIDGGLHFLPEKFLTKSALSIAPGGIERTGNRPFQSLFKPEDIKNVSFTNLENIKSEMGLLRRLDDSTCIGCHQTRAIGGFHFMGKDPAGKYRGNAVFLPGSAHFMGDLPRRRAILEDIAGGKSVIDFSRGFSARPQARRSEKLNGSGLLNGWGGHCSVSPDPSFKSWTCAEGLSCKVLLNTKDGLGMGICLTTEQQVGSPCESGNVKSTGFAIDRYIKTSPDHPVLTVANSMCSPQSQDPGTKTGGFLNGNIRTKSCENLPKEASCGPLPASKPGFNSCLGHRNFGDCVKEYALPVGLRGCDQMNPCRDDYICSESFEPQRGSCVPPYFLFQFRVDGHPKGDKKS